MTQINSGDTAFMIVAASLVMLMTPGLAFFYGGLVSRKTVLSIMIQSFVSMAVTDVVWYMVGYSLAFSTDVGNGFIGNLDKAFLMNISSESVYAGNTGLPELVFVVYQMMFAVITPALITGAFANRVRFKAYLIFLVFWLLFVYIPWVHWVWGGGFLFQWGVLDFAGGIVVHTTAGMASLASVLYVGSRKEKKLEPHSLPLVALGTGLLWFGWYGFNAGSAIAANGITSLAFFNTDISASTAAVTWMVIEWNFSAKPKFLGLLTGAVAGLATITPAAGFVPTWAAFIIGILAGIICYFAVWVKGKVGLDDALDVFGVHGVGGILGVICTGLFASKEINPLGADGLFFGGAAFFCKELVAVIFAAVWAFLFSYAMLWVIDKITPVKVAQEAQGDLDLVEFGEHAYIEGNARF
jgi:Amt family ammonium transporter